MPAQYRPARPLFFLSLLWASCHWTPEVQAQAPDQPSPAPLALSAPATIAPQEVPAAGRQRALIRVEKPGRYAVVATSRSKVTLQLVDRMAGPGKVVGVIGKEDGRLDVFLDRGEYLVLIEGSKSARDVVALAVTLFAERNAESLALPEARLVAEELGDFEELSFWIELDQRRRVVLEAAGRHLRDLRLWRDGSWLVDAEPVQEQIDPTPGRPLNLLRLTSDLPAGLYRLSASGGPGTAWVDDDGSKPLYLRSGLPRRPEAARQRLTLSPFGFDRFLVPQAAGFLRLELPARGLPVGSDLTLEAQNYVEHQPFQTYWEAGGEWGQITKETNPPLVELSLYAANSGLRLVTVRGRAGENYLLQHFNPTRTREIQDKGNVYIATVHSGDALDSVDATGILARFRSGYGRSDRPLQAESADVLTLKPGVAFKRPLQLLSAATLFVRVEVLGDYEFKRPGTGLRLEPFLIPGSREGSGRPPEREESLSLKLDPGFYVLSLNPRGTDIHDLTVRSVVSYPSSERTFADGNVELGARSLETDSDYVLYLNTQPEVRAGLLLRRWPLDLELGLPIQISDRPVELEFQAAARGRLRALGEDGATFMIAVDQGGSTSERSAELWVDPGTYKLSVFPQAGQSRSAFANLLLESEHLLAGKQLPRVPAEVMGRLPIFPQLDGASTRFFNLERGDQKTFLVKAETPSLYRLESEGLLDTEAFLRTRLQPVLASAAADGSGRNFLIQRYLRPGDYQVTVRAQGQSRGHLGLKLSRSTIQEAGKLLAGKSARHELVAGRGLAYELEVTTAGRYRLRSQGLGRLFEVRLEDQDGWPVIAPGLLGDLTLELEPGRYRYLVLPQAVDTRQVSSLELLPPPLEFAGHGPFDLPFDTLVNNRWLEPEAESGPRMPDLWRFTLPATAEVKIELDQEMEAEIRSSAKNAGSEVARVRPGRVFLGTLAAGDYELHVVCSRVNSRVDYGLRLSTTELIAGTTRTLTPPATLGVAIGGAGDRGAPTIEIASTGQVDVAARLIDQTGNELRAVDDRPGDWNFVFEERLEAGRYALAIERIFGQGPVEVTMRQLSERVEPALEIGVKGREAKLTLGDDVVVWPLVIESSAELLALEAKGDLPLRLVLEGRAGAGQSWRSLASQDGLQPRLLYRLDAAATRGDLRLRLSGGTKAGVQVRLRAAAPAVAAVSEAQAAQTLTFKPIPFFDDLGFARIRLERRGCFELDRLKVATAPGLLVAEKLVGAENELLVAGPRLGGFRLLRRQLAAGTTELALPAEGRLTCDLPSPKAAVAWLMRAEGLTTAPILTGKSSAQTQVGTAALAVLPARGSTVQLEGKGGTAVGVELKALPVPQALEALDWGTRALRLSGGAAQSATLPEGGKTLRLILGRGLVAWGASPEAAGAGGGSDSGLHFLHWAKDQDLDVMLESDVRQLEIFNLSATEALWSADVLPLDKLEPLSAGRPLERRLAQAGRFEARVEAAAGGRIRVGGAVEALLFGDDGTVARGFDLPAKNGRLQIEPADALTGLPLIWAWLEDERAAESSLAGLLGLSSLPQPTPLSAPVALALKGESMAFVVELAAPTALSLRTETPLALALEKGDGVRTLRLFDVNLDDALLLPAGRHTLAVRGVAGAPLFGRLEVRAHPVALLAEGLGPEVQLAPGLRSFFSFEVPTDRKLGVAVRAPGRVDIRLFDEVGRELGRGLSLMPELKAGTYLLELRAFDAAVSARPALVGRDARGIFPPADVVELYVRGTAPLQPVPVESRPPEPVDEANDAAAAEAEEYEEESSEEGEESEGEEESEGDQVSERERR